MAYGVNYYVLLLKGKIYEGISAEIAPTFFFVGVLRVVIGSLCRIKWMGV